MTKVLFPGWRYGPNGELELFQRAEDVPEGWSRTNPLADPLKRPSASLETLVEAAKAFDHDGDGKPGGSKPRRKVARRDPRK